MRKYVLIALGLIVFAPIAYGAVLIRTANPGSPGDVVINPNSPAIWQPDSSFTPPNLAVGLVGYWTFDGNRLIQNVTDSVGGQNGRLISFTSTTTTRGQIGQALTFDGVDDYVRGTNSVSITSTQTSVSVWVNVGTGGLNPRVFDISDGTNSIQLLIEGVSNKWATKHTQYNTSLDALAWSTPVLGKWQHLVAVFDSAGSTSAFYVNGVRQTSAANFTVGPSGVANVFSFGERSDAVNGTIYFGGLMDDVRLYNRALSAQEVEQLYKLGI